MPDREKVIGGLAACTGEPNGCAGHTCPYWDFDDSESDWGCRGQLELDALALLKEQDAVEPNREMSEIREKEIMMPVAVLGRNCEHCEMLDIRVITEKLYADGNVIGT